MRQPPPPPLRHGFLLIVCPDDWATWLSWVSAGWRRATARSGACTGLRWPYRDLVDKPTCRGWSAGTGQEGNLCELVRGPTASSAGGVEDCCEIGQVQGPAPKDSVHRQEAAAPPASPFAGAPANTSLETQLVGFSFWLH